MARRDARWMWLALAGAMAMPLVTGGCVRSPATGRMQFIVISTEQEIALGADAAPEVEKQFGGLVPDKVLQDYVADIGGKVAATAERKMPYEFHLIGSDIPNAFALPGGRIYITSGLLVRMTNERQLAAVLGHEVGHVTDRHSVQQLQRQMGAGLLAELAAAAVGGEAGSAAKVGVKIAAGMENLRYGRGHEYQSDELGIRYMANAGYNPWGMVELLKVLQAASNSGEASWMEMLQTHPLTSKRIEQAEVLVREMHPDASASAPDPNVARFRRMQVRQAAFPPAKPPSE